MKQLDDAAREITQWLANQGIEYAVMGGLAVRAYAMPRATYDVDLTIALPRERLPELYDGLEQLGYSTSETQRGGWVDSVKGLPVVKVQLWTADKRIDIDIFLAETPFQRELLKRKRSVSAEGWTAWYVAPEDLILLKLLAGRPKDLVDVADVFFIQGELDQAHLRHWAEQLGIVPQLESALRQADVE